MVIERATPRDAPAAARLAAAKLAAAGYEPASDWFSTGIGPVTNDAARWLP